MQTFNVCFCFILMQSSLYEQIQISLSTKYKYLLRDRMEFSLSLSPSIEYYYLLHLTYFANTKKCHKLTPS